MSVVSGCAGEGVDRSHQQRALLASAAPGSDGGLETSSFEVFYGLPQACRGHQDAGVGFLEFVGDGSTAAQHGVNGRVARLLDLGGVAEPRALLF